MNQQMDLLGAWAVARERELWLVPRGRPVRRAAPRPVDHRRARHRRPVSAAAGG